MCIIIITKGHHNKVFKNTRPGEMARASSDLGTVEDRMIREDGESFIRLRESYIQAITIMNRNNGESFIELK